MAQRKTTAARKGALAESLREASRNGSLKPGDMLPTARVLSERYVLSMRTVILELQKLVNEGVLYTVPRVGTFVGTAPSAGGDYYLLLASSKKQPGGQAHWVSSIKFGFEAKIAQLGASCLTMPIETALETKARGEMPPLAGVFDFTYHPKGKSLWEHVPDVPWVEFASGEETLPRDLAPDRVAFDDVDGGRQATEHLIKLGHQKIGFLGLHPTEESAKIHLWSELRQRGWNLAMEKAGLPVRGMHFSPPVEIGRFGDEVGAAKAAAIEMLESTETTAVVGANDNAVLGLFWALKELCVPESSWPAAVGFDGILDKEEHVLTSIRTPWEEVGQMAASLLWERRTGRLIGEPQLRTIKMKLIPRLTSIKALAMESPMAFAGR